MAIHEIYIGGPPTRNYSRAAFPAPPFVASAAPFQQVKVSAHKAPTAYGLTRVIDTRDHALSEFLRENVVAAGDSLGAILIPKNVVVKGFFFEVERAAGDAVTLTPAIRGLAGATLPDIDANVVGKGFAKLGGAAWQAASGAAAGDDFYMADPGVLDLTLTTMATGLGSLRVVITPLVDTLYHGEP